MSQRIVVSQERVQLPLPVARPQSARPDVRLWCLSLAQIPSAAMLEQISDAERSRASRFARREDFDRFVKTRGALRLILAAGAGAPARGLHLSEGADGKPRLADNPLGLHFSVSHSAGYALIGVGWRPLGIDIERVRSDIDWRPIAAKSLHPRERAALHGSSMTTATAAFFQIWTHKEAYLKAIGCGVAGDLASFAIDPAGGPVCVGGERAPAAWFTQALTAPAGYKAALATSFSRPDVCDVTPSFAGFCPFFANAAAITAPSRMVAVAGNAASRMSAGRANVHLESRHCSG
jgi:4'-phosphopantetheinyl transferase